MRSVHTIFFCPFEFLCCRNWFGLNFLCPRSPHSSHLYMLTSFGESPFIVQSTHTILRPRDILFSLSGQCLFGLSSYLPSAEFSVVPTLSDPTRDSVSGDHGCEQLRPRLGGPDVDPPTPNLNGRERRGLFPLAHRAQVRALSNRGNAGSTHARGSRVSNATSLSHSEGPHVIPRLDLRPGIRGPATACRSPRRRGRPSSRPRHGARC